MAEINHTTTENIVKTSCITLYFTVQHYELQIESLITGVTSFFISTADCVSHVTITASVHDSESTYVTAHLVQMKELSDEISSISLCVKKSQLPDKITDLFVRPDDHGAERGCVSHLLEVLVDVGRVEELHCPRDRVNRRAEMEPVETRFQQTA